MAKMKLNEQIQEELLDIIKKNSDNKNYKLPSERLLATRFNVSRPTIRAAYQKLIQQGYVEGVHGKGYFIKNDAQSSLKSQVKLHLLFIVPSLKTTLMQQIYSGIMDFCEENNIELSIKITEEKRNKEKQILELAFYSHYDGLILFPVDDEYYNETLLKISISKYPIVLIDRYIKALNLSFVSTDNYNAMINIVKYLHSKQYKNPVYVTHETSLATTVEERVNGYNTGLLKCYRKIKNSNLLILKSNDRNYVYKTIKDFIQNNPTIDALIITDVYLSTAYSAITELNIPVPEKLRFVMFDNEVSFAEKKAIRPYIIEQDGRNIGYFAAQYVYNQIMGDKRIQTKKFPVEIIGDEND